MTQKNNKFSTAFFMIVVLFEITFIKLAYWQYHRMLEKESLFNHYQQKMEEEAAVFNPEKNYKEWDVVTLTGRFNYKAEKLLQNRHYKSYRGYRILTPFILTSGEKILVDRGWIPESYDREDPKELVDKQGVTTVMGSVRSVPIKDVWLHGPLYGVSNRIIKRIDMQAFPQISTYKSIFIQAVTSHNKNVRAFVEKPTSGGRHSEYMLTWLALAFILPTLYAALLWQKYRTRK